MSKFTELSEVEKREYFSQKTKEWRKNHPRETRDMNRKACRNYRKSEKWKEYYSNYFKEWRENPLNSICHQTRCTIASIKSQLKKNPEVELREENIKLLNNLHKVGWDIDLPENKCLNHIVSLFWLHSFKLDLPREITCDFENLEICDKVNNNRLVKRIINKKVLDTAKKLERKFKELEGFYEFLKKNEGVRK